MAVRPDVHALWRLKRVVAVRAGAFVAGMTRLVSIEDDHIWGIL